MVKMGAQPDSRPLGDQPFPITDGHGTQLIGLVLGPEASLIARQPLTHAVVVARCEGRILLVFNRSKQYWELPGGGLDDGEHLRGCAVRELEEEAGIVCRVDALGYACGIEIRAGGHVQYGAVYVADIPVEPAFVPNEEIAAVCWWNGRDRVAGLSAVDAALIRAVEGVITEPPPSSLHDARSEDAIGRSQHERG